MPGVHAPTPGGRAGTCFTRGRKDKSIRNVVHFLRKIDMRDGRNAVFASSHLRDVDAGANHAKGVGADRRGNPPERRKTVMSGANPTKSTLQQRARGLITGTQKHLANETLAFNGATFAAPALIQLLQQLIDVVTRSDAARAEWKDALKSMKDGKATIVPVLGAFHAFVVNRFGNAPSTLEDFGIAPRKVRTPLTAEQKAAAAVKRKATRAARHIVGKKQRAKIKAPVATTPTATAPGTPPTHGT
jgi:hypothetical protein